MPEDFSISYDPIVKPIEEIGLSKNIVIAETYENSPILQSMPAASGVHRSTEYIDAEGGKDIEQTPTECAPSAPADDADPVEDANGNWAEKITTAEEVSSPQRKKAKRSTYWLTVVKIGENRYECRPARHGVKWPDGQGELTRNRRVAMLAKYMCVCRIADYLTTHCQKFLASGSWDALAEAMAENVACQNGDACPFVQKDFHALLLLDEGSFPKYSGFTRIVKTVVIRWGFRTDLQSLPLATIFSHKYAKEWRELREKRDLEEIAKNIRIKCRKLGEGKWPREEDWAAIAAARGTGEELTTFQSSILALIRPRGKNGKLDEIIEKLEKYAEADGSVGR